MVKILVAFVLASILAVSMAGYASHDVTYHPGYGGYGHGVSVRHDVRPYAHSYAVPYVALPYAYAAPYGGYGYGGYGYGAHPVAPYW